MSITVDGCIVNLLCFVRFTVWWNGEQRVIYRPSWREKVAAGFFLADEPAPSTVTFHRWLMERDLRPVGGVRVTWSVTFNGYRWICPAERSIGSIYRDPRRTSKCLAAQVLRLVDLLSSSSLSEKISRDIWTKFKGFEEFMGETLKNFLSSL